MRVVAAAAGLLFGCFFLVESQLARAEESDEGFPFAIPFDGLLEGSAPALLARPPAPAGAEGFVSVSGDRFLLSQSGRPIRFWGTNLCFAGNFPPHEVSRRLAARLASLGINCVRFHHMDAYAYPRGIWKGTGRRDFPHVELDPEALERLDYLVAQLKENGVYTDLNLHVSRTYGAADGFPVPAEGESVPDYGKGVDNFCARAIAEQKRYAAMLLRHVNAYTGNAYAEEPAVAIVEINNENGLLAEWAGGNLDHLPRPYLDELQELWNRWLLRKYESADAVRAAWAEGEAEGNDVNLLAAPGVRAGLQVLGEARAELTDARPDGRAGRIVVQQASPTGWHVQYIWGGLAVQAAKPYVLRIRLRANREAQVNVGCHMDHAPWQDLGLSRSVTVTPQWRDEEFRFTARTDDAPDAEARGGARITLSGLSQEALEVSFAEPSLQQPPVRGLPAGQGLRPGTVRWPVREELEGRTPAVRLDVVRFLRETEAAYWQGMRDYLHTDLGVRMPVTGTAAGYVSPYVAAETVDFVDAHAYWQHPRFPGRPWDQANWYVSNDAMVNIPERATMVGLAGRRVFGRPLTVTEYNHPQPHHYQVEGFPLASVYGSFQGWDGLFEFAYSHDDRWETDHFSNFFDMKADPVKLAFMPACADIFLEGRVGPPAATIVGRLSPAEQLKLLAESPRSVDAYGSGVDRVAWQNARLGLSVGGSEPADVAGPPGVVQWEGNPTKGLVSFVGQGCAGLLGFAEGRSVSGGGVSLTAGPTALGGFSAVMVNSVEGQALGEDGRYLITAASRSWNRNMGWNEQRNSVGRNWGEGSTLCDGVPVVLRADVGERPARLYALRPDGGRASEIPPRTGEDAVFDLGPAYRTLWYELVIGG
jgi:hypothetical protein